LDQSSSPAKTFEAIREQLARAYPLAQHESAAMAASGPAFLRTVLVVEDEMMLRMRAVDMVEDAGFTSVEAINADDALAILESRSDIELLFTDIPWMASSSPMPSMSVGR
jgi:PleD family two-component response regulator